MGTRRQSGRTTVIEAGSRAQTDDATALEETLERVEALSDWGLSWKDYSAPPPTPERIAESRAWIEAMHADAVSTGVLWCTPLVTASEDGEILFEWWSEPKRLAVYITENGAEYIKAWGSHIFNEMEEGSASDSESRRALWLWLMKNP